MQINKNGYIAQFYKWTYGLDNQELGRLKNFCAFFWMYVVALLFIPLTLPSYPVVKLIDKKNIGLPFSFKLLITLGYVMLAIGIIAFFDDEKFRIAVYIVIGCFVVVGLVIGVVIGLCHYLTNEEDSNNKVSNFFREMKSMAVTKKDSFINNWCPKIKWDNYD